MSHEPRVIWRCTDVQQLLVQFLNVCILMELYDKLFTQFSSNLSKHNSTGRLQHLIRHLLNVWSPDLHVGSHTVATAANPTRTMNRPLKQQENELGPNTWQQRQEMAKYDKKVHIFLFHLHSNLQVRQQHCRYTTGPQAGSPIYPSPSLPKRSDCMILSLILWVLGALHASKAGQGRKLLTKHVMWALTKIDIYIYIYVNTCSLMIHVLASDDMAGLKPLACLEHTHIQGVPGGMCQTWGRCS